MTTAVSIPRTMFTAEPPRLRAGEDARTLIENQRALLRYTLDLQRQLQEVYRVLAKRSNEQLLSGLFAERPPAGVANRLYLATDLTAGANAFVDNGTAWQLI